MNAHADIYYFMSNIGLRCFEISVDDVMENVQPFITNLDVVVKRTYNVKKRIFSFVLYLTSPIVWAVVFKTGVLFFNINPNILILLMFSAN